MPTVESVVAAGNVAAGNAEQARAWDGAEGAYWTEHEARYDGALRAYRPVFNECAAVTATDAVLDVGCGTGQSTRDAARAARSGSALGVDLSARMIRRAAERAAEHGLANATFRRADAQIHPFEPASFDIVISRMGAMFFGDRAAAFANLARALRPGGRMTLLAWQRLDRNAWITAIRNGLAAGRDLPVPSPVAPGPFALAAPGLVEPVLAAAGFTGIRFDAVNAPFYVGADVDDATDFATGNAFSRWLLSDLDEAARAAAIERVRATMAVHASPAGVCLASNAGLITARRA
jgi:SAM-dependent methyltransferase